METTSEGSILSLLSICIAEHLRGIIYLILADNHSIGTTFEPFLS